MKCVKCDSETSNPKFCSRSCAASFTNMLNPKRKLTRKCNKCDSIIRNSRSTLCELHFIESKNQFKKDMTIGDYRNKTSVKNKHPSWIHAHIRNFARSWLKHLTVLPCAKCGYDKHVELAHIKAVSEFEDDTPLNVVNSENNVLPLCPNCHWEFDNLPRENFFNKMG